MRYFYIEGYDWPKHCIYGPRPREAVFFTDWEWWNINDNLHRWNREKQNAEMYLAKEKNKKEMSYNMTKNWQNTLASIKVQSEQRRIDKRNKDKQDKIDQYNRILENRKEERKPMLAGARRLLFEGKDETRTITSALVFCEVLTEREKQIQFKKFKKEEEAKRCTINIQQDVEDYWKTEQEKKKQKLEETRKFRQSLKEQAEERKKRIEEAETKERLALQQDLVKMAEAMKKHRECEMKEKQDRIKRTRMSYEKGYHATELDKSLAIEEEEENEVNKMINKYAKRLATERAKKEATMIEEAVKNREKRRELLAMKIAGKERNEDAILEKVVKEQEEEAAKRAKEKEEETRRMKAEMDKWNEEHKARVAAERFAEKNAFKWTILQNERKREVDRAFEEELKRKAREEKERTREGYAKQVREKQEAAELYKKQDSVFFAKKNEDADELLKYCDEAVEYAKKREWKNYPLLAAVAKVKKDCGVPVSPTTQDGDDREKKTSECQKAQNSGKPIASFGYDCYCFKN